MSKYDISKNSNSNDVKSNYNKHKNQLSIEKMIFSPEFKSEPIYSIQNKPKIVKKQDNTINLRMDEIDNYPTHKEMSKAVNFKEIKDFKIKDLIKFKREKSREKSRENIKKSSTPLFELNLSEIMLKQNQNIPNMDDLVNTNLINIH